MKIGVTLTSNIEVKDGNAKLVDATVLGALIAVDIKQHGEGVLAVGVVLWEHNRSMEQSIVPLNNLFWLSDLEDIDDGDDEAAS